MSTHKSSWLNEDNSKKHGRYLRNFLDFLFPRNDIEKRIDSLPASQLFEILPKAEKSRHNHIFSVFNYQDKNVREIIYSIKFRGNKRILRKIGSFVSDEVVEKYKDKIIFNEIEKPLLVPVPLSTKRKRERGFNQSEKIARVIYKHNPEFFDGIDVGLLKRVRHTNPQTGIKNRKERQKNVKDAFCVKKPKKINGKTILLIDDVTTTGSTLKEGRKALKKSGAKWVEAVTLAH